MSSQATVFVTPANAHAVSIPTAERVEVTNSDNVRAESFRAALANLGEWTVTIYGRSFAGIYKLSVNLSGKLVEYYPATGIYRVWIDGLPVFESVNGKVCSDVNALADSLC